MDARRNRVIGWPLVGVNAVLVVAFAALAWVIAGGGEAGIRSAIRTTARTSLLLFLAAFVASSLNALWPRPWTKALLANRRYVGVSFAVSHLWHAVAIWLLAVEYPRSFWPGVTWVTFAGGGVGYLFLALMVATSFDRTTAWLGHRRWKLLHTTGIYVIWVIFTSSYAPRAFVAPIYLLPTVALLLGFGLRFSARVLARRRRRLAV